MDAGQRGQAELTWFCGFNLSAVRLQFRYWAKLASRYLDALGSSTHHVFTVSNGKTLKLENLTLKGMSGTFGGGVYVDGDSTNRGTLRMSGGEISGNKAGVTGGPETYNGEGGGIANHGKVFKMQVGIYRNSHSFKCNAKAPEEQPLNLASRLFAKLQKFSIPFT